jgi:hypothetical protein
MNEQEIQLKKDFITTLANELKSHYYIDEFFVDPEKKFIGLLEKIIVSCL